MKVERLTVAFIVMVASLAAFAPTWAQDDEPDYEATIAALETQVTELEATIAAGQTPTPLAPTATPAPGSAVQADEAIPISDAFVVLYYYFAFEDGNLAVYGEMQNVSSSGQLAPYVSFTFLDADGNSYGSDQAAPTSHWVEAGQRMSFSLFSLLGGALAPGDWASVEVTAGDPASDFYIRDTSMLTIEGAPVEGPSEPVSGRIVNSGATSVTGLSAYVDYFDEEGIYIGSCTGFSPSSDAIIPPGGSIRFEAGGGGCGNTAIAIAARGSQGPFTQRLVVTRSERPS
jgi:hypothetical protein